MNIEDKIDIVAKVSMLNSTLALVAKTIEELNHTVSELSKSTANLNKVVQNAIYKPMTEGKE